MNVGRLNLESMLLYIICCFQVQREAARRTEEAADKVEKVNSYGVSSSHKVSYRISCT